jgi:hypothetical protein
MAKVVMLAKFFATIKSPTRKTLSFDYGKQEEWAMPSAQALRSNSVNTLANALRDFRCDPYCIVRWALPLINSRQQ